MSHEEDSVVDALVQASFGTMAVLSRIGADHDLSLTQLRVLGILRDRRVRMSDLADFLGLERSTLSGLVDRAQRRGLVRRAANPVDGRAVDVFLSAKGKRLAQSVHATAVDEIAPMIGGLASAERVRLGALLARVRAP